MITFNWPASAFPDYFWKSISHVQLFSGQYQLSLIICCTVSVLQIFTGQYQLSLIMAAAPALSTLCVLPDYLLQSISSSDCSLDSVCPPWLLDAEYQFALITRCIVSAPPDNWLHCMSSLWLLVVVRVCGWSRLICSLHAGEVLIRDCYYPPPSPNPLHPATGDGTGWSRQNPALSSRPFIPPLPT
jgi:hypothetical protein